MTVTYNHAIIITHKAFQTHNGPLNMIIKVLEWPFCIIAHIKQHAGSDFLSFSLANIPRKELISPSFFLLQGSLAHTYKSCFVFRGYPVRPIV